MKEQWLLPREGNAEFVCAMEAVLEVYHRPYDAKRPVVCCDEASEQLLADVREPLPPRPGEPLRVDYEYERRGPDQGTVGVMHGYRCAGRLAPARSQRLGAADCEEGVFRGETTSRRRNS